MIRKGLAPGMTVPRKSPTVVGAGLPPKKLGRSAVRSVAPQKSAKSWSPAAGDGPMIKQPMRHVEQPPIRQFADYWRGGCSIGDALVAADDMKVVMPNAREQVPVHPYLGADHYYGGESTAQPVARGSYGIYAGPIRVIERGKTGNVSVLRHTAIFASGRYILADLNLVHPADVL